MTAGVNQAKEFKDIKPKDFKLTAKQEVALKIIKSTALYILLFGGSRSTKTFLLVWIIVWRAMAVKGSRHAILRFRFNHVKASIIYDTFPKVMTLCFPACPFKIDKQDWFVKFPNGSEIWFGGLDDKERTEKILGNEYATIFLNECSQISYPSFLTLKTRLAQKCFFEDEEGNSHLLRAKMLFDENPPSKGHWTYKLFLDKMEPNSRRKVKRPEDYDSLLMNPIDNKENLTEEYLRILDELPKRQRDRFFLGKFADESENALWTAEIIDRNRINSKSREELLRIVVAVDPSGAGDEDNKDNDEIGIIVAGLGIDGIGYLLEDLTLKAGPATWGKVVTDAYFRWRADRIIGEANYGGAMVEHVIKTSDPLASYVAVHASRGKVVRAEPISALHETGKIKYVGNFDELEDECCSMTTYGYMGEGSPNRVDAKVWAFTELFPGITQPVVKEPEFYTIPKKKRF